MNKLSILTIILLLILTFSCQQASDKAQNDGSEVNSVNTDPLPSWNDGVAKTTIKDFVTDVTDPQSNNFIEISDRIATFDNDGTLWAEQPMYFQLFFAIDRVKELAPEHPEWNDMEPFKSILNNDMQGVMASGIPGLLKIVMETHAGITTEEFLKIAKDWAKTARHPKHNRPFTELVYQPMLELLKYLRANGFKTYIVSAGGVDFMRALVTEIYGIPEEQIIGSSIATEYNYNEGDPEIRRAPKVDFINDHEGKPVNIQKIIGKKPIFAGGNSDGDLEMLQWTASNQQKSLMLYVHHTDSIREWAYDRESHIGRFDKGLDEARLKEWIVINMKEDWKVIYPFELN